MMEFTVQRYGLHCFSIQVVLAADLFSSVKDMENLVRQEDRLINTLNSYITIQQESLRLLNMKLEQLSRERPEGMSVEDIVGDPAHAFALVRRLVRDWPLILGLVIDRSDISLEAREEMSRLPGEEDLESAVKGLARLQTVYQLDTKRLTRDNYYGQLNAMDCFEIGKHLLHRKHYEFAASWFEEAIGMIDNNDKTINKGRVEPYSYLASYLSGGNNRRTGLLHYLMTAYPNFALDKDTAPLFKETFSSTWNAVISNVTEMERALAEEFRVYSETCRQVGLNHSSELRCFYIHHNNPRLLIAPFKMEEKNLDPPILMFHEVISDREIQEMMSAFAQVRGSCSVVILDGQTALDDYRTCDVGWLKDEDTPVSARITRRVGDMTDLDMETSEDNQVANYGVGGAYLLHRDPIPDLNEVEEGGHTAFPLLHTAVRPTKGSALFWFNLDHRSADLLSVFHGGCPVVRGSKTVLNKWIHEGKQKSDMFCPKDEKFPKPRYYMSGINR